MRTICAFHRLLLAGVLCCLPVALFAAKYDPTPAPTEMEEGKITAALAEMKDSLFFVSNFTFNGKATVEFDGFLIPNGSYAKLEAVWEKLIDAEGKELQRDPAAQDKVKWADSWSRIYLTEKKAHPAIAHGKVTVQVPCAFTRLEFAANEVNVTKTAPPLTVMLQKCEGNTAALKLRGFGKEEPILILRDATGQRLKQQARGWTRDPDEREMTLTMQGTIARIEVFYPTRFAASTLDVTATAAPEIFRVPAPVIDTPRFAPAGILLQGTTIDQATLQARTSVVARRNYAMTGYNQHTLVVKLPRAANSALARVDFGTPKLLDADGNPVKYTIGQGIFEEIDTEEIRFESMRDFTRIVGNVSIRYPGILKIATLTPAQPQVGTLAAQFRGAKLAVSGLTEPPLSYYSDEIPLISAYDAAGRRLRRLSYSGSESRNNVNRILFAFWGTPAKVQIIVPDNWLTLTLPFDLPTAPKLPSLQEGLRPAEYD